MAKDNFLYFHESLTAPNTPGEAALYKSSNFLMANVSAGDHVQLSFKARNGSLSDDVVTLRIGTTGTIRQCMQRIAQALSSPKGGLFIDDEFQSKYTMLDGRDLGVGGQGPVLITTTTP